jgi:protein gp37
MNQTKIAYVDVSWNPVTGCSDEFPCWSCCWAKRDAKRLEHNPCVHHRERYKGFKLAFWPERLDEPLRMRKPRRIAVSFMGDLFHKTVPDDWIDKVFAVLALLPQHTFLVLTKRPERMAEYLTNTNLEDRLCDIWYIHYGRELQPEQWVAAGRGRFEPLPPDNCWFGTSVSNQAEADFRIPALLKCPGKLWLSIEPMQGPIEITATYETHGALLSRIRWVVCGGGPVPVHPNDVRSIRDQCAAAGVPWWFKQWGAPSCGCGLPGNATHEAGYRICEKKGGDWLDGRQWHELPEGMK